MPQMSPMMWTWLLFMFNFTLILTMILNYYSFLYLPSNKIYNKSSMMKTKFWKW
uniref:ATP synthase F0 subunit 8 n=1 Tax=Hylastes attenuatus TaxID=471226 RepID=A0A343A6I7_9CUCU|nr:ATP synthase F0 subunit 8 [Hylastes attenuatus]AOY40179.1 ATP synthase F0 subunit 8 [Hylastes attenuatus]